MCIFQHSSLARRDISSRICSSVVIVRVVKQMSSPCCQSCEAALFSLVFELIRAELRGLQDMLRQASESAVSHCPVLPCAGLASHTRHRTTLRPGRG